MDTVQLIERAQRTLGIRQKALKVTLEEIQLLEQLANDRDYGPGVATALAEARSKRDRQQSACQATEAIIASFQALKAKRAK